MTHRGCRVWARELSVWALELHGSEASLVSALRL